MEYSVLLSSYEQIERTPFWVSSYTSTLKTFHLSPMPIPKKKAIRESEWLFSTKSAFVGINPLSWVKSLRDEILLRGVMGGGFISFDILGISSCKVRQRYFDSLKRIDNSPLFCYTVLNNSEGR